MCITVRAPARDAARPLEENPVTRLSEPPPRAGEDAVRRGVEPAAPGGAPRFDGRAVAGRAAATGRRVAVATADVAREVGRGLGQAGSRAVASAGARADRRRAARRRRGPGPLARRRATVLPASGTWWSKHRYRVAIADRPLLMRLLALLTSAAAVVLVLVMTAGAIVPAAVSSAAEAVDVEFRLPEQVSLAALEQRSIIYDSSGALLAVLDREVSRTTVTLAEVPLHVQQAIITAEDRKFYEHKGYDVEGIGRALLANVETRTISQGGSTITQQLAKTQVGSQKTLDRKVTELAYAIALEKQFTKDQLLQQYLNQVFFGSRAYGIYAAAGEFFGVAPDQLTVEQGALLAGLIRSPNSTDPRQEPDVALARRNQILEDMVTEGYLDPAQLAPLQATPLGIQPPPPPKERSQPHFVNAVEREFLANPVFGATPEERERLLYSGGLEITTTLDPRLQQLAAQVVDAQFPTERGITGAIATVDPISGRVLAAYGGLAFGEEQYDLATQGRRQPGSAFKPFVYAEALQAGFPLKLRLIGSSPAYFPGIAGWDKDDDRDAGVKNYGGGSYGPVDIRQALVRSVNTAAAQMITLIGVDRVKRLVDRLGIDIGAAMLPEDGPAISLGGLGWGVTPLEMASAYATFANDGIHVRPHVIAQVTDRGGNVLYTDAPQAERVLDSQVNAAMVSVMQDVVRGGTATRARLRGWDAAGKTGTTQDNSDAWFVGFTPVLSTAVWMGHPKERVPMPGTTGGSLPASMWREFMTGALEGREPVPFADINITAPRIPTGGPEIVVPDVTGLPAGEALEAIRAAGFNTDVKLSQSKAERGTVIGQSPRAARTARGGQTVTLTIATDQVAAARPSPRPSGAAHAPAATATPSPEPSAEPTGGDDGDADEPVPAPEATSEGEGTDDAGDEGDGEDEGGEDSPGQGFGRGNGSGGDQGDGEGDSDASEGADPDATPSD